MSERLPRIGEKRYFMHQEVIIIRTLDCFHLAEIKALKSEKIFCVDICTLTIEPDFTNSLSL